MDALAIGVALALGLAARQIGLPPLVGFLVAGFALKAWGAESGDTLKEIADLGVTLLLFSIGLKLDLRSLLRPQVWAVASLHMVAVVTAFGLGFAGLAAAGLSVFAELERADALLIAFAASFSSTVFAVKVLEEKGEMVALHGAIAIGILIVQDLFAVGFLAFAAGKVPGPVGVVVVVVLVAFQGILRRIAALCGHGELLLLFGILVALGGAEAFETVGIKGDLGALFLGVLLAGGAKAEELAKALLSFKDLFLVGFFLTIGLSGTPGPATVGAAVLLAALMPLKVALFFWLLTRYRMRARSAFLASLALANYSEFGLIVGGIAAGRGWIGSEWLLVFAIALSITFVIASPLNAKALRLFDRFGPQLLRFESRLRLPEETPIDPGDAVAVIFGMGRVGTGAYDAVRERLGGVVLGVDASRQVVERHQQAGRRVVLGNTTDLSFWERLATRGHLRLALLTMGSHQANLRAAKEIRNLRALEPGEGLGVFAAARFPDQSRQLGEAGADLAVDFYADAGVGLAQRMFRHLEDGSRPS